MARHEADREDLFAEAAALVRRLEGAAGHGAPQVVAGFRVDGVLVVYLGSEFMVQFDFAGRVRRAYLNGDLYRAQQKTLCRLVRSRTAAETALLRHDLTSAELAELRTLLLDEIASVAAAIRSGVLSISRKHPAEDTTLEAEIAERLERAIAVADWIASPITGKP